MGLHLYNTEARKKEPLLVGPDNLVRMYTCGPTVYNFAHVGNFRTYLFEDLLRRTIKFFGMQVEQVMNLTDLDDKTIKGTIEQNNTLEEFTRPYIQAFFEDLHTLRVEPAEHYPAATHFIPDMIQMIEGLLAKGYAYEAADGCIYYAIRKFKRYGCLSHLHLDELQAGASERIVTDEYEKENVADFVLWKSFDPERDGKVYWNSPFGRGRPGWHLECSVMAMKILGSTLDIHCGGIDNMFPHHENEIAQSEAYSGQRFVKIWMHSEHLVVDGKKMSKSLGNFFTLRDLLKRGFDPVQIRYMLLQTHYKTQLNFTFAGLEAAKGSLQRLQDFIYRLQGIRSNESYGLVETIATKAYDLFRSALGDDLNISAALAALFDLVREVNGLCDAGKMGAQEAQFVLELLKKMDQVLAVLDFTPQEEAVPKELQEALEKRIEARQQKNWALADSLRNFILSQGYVIEDTASGARLKKSG
jgi:cysteinyl-tRNA synthetase